MHAKHDTRVRIFSTSNHNIAGSTKITTSPQLHHMGAATIVDAQISSISRFLAHSETIDVPIYSLGHDDTSGAEPRLQNRFAICKTAQSIRPPSDFDTQR